MRPVTPSPGAATPDAWMAMSRTGITAFRSWLCDASSTRKEAAANVARRFRLSGGRVLASEWEYGAMPTDRSRHSGTRDESAPIRRVRPRQADLFRLG